MPISASVFQDCLAMSRLLVPEPSVFAGDSIRFIEWKFSFIALIEGKCISSAEKLFYLKKYVSGPVSKALAGIFFKTDYEAYHDAWEKLNCCYGQPFAIQRAFRERLANWPKIHSKDAIGLWNLSDFLSACENAVPHVKGLQILNDCQENQKLVQKLPDWAASRWNRQVTQALSKNQEFPDFKEFWAFESAEADTACNPVTSFQALHALSPVAEKLTLNETKNNKAWVFNTLNVKVRNHWNQWLQLPVCCANKVIISSITVLTSVVNHWKNAKDLLKSKYFIMDAWNQDTLQVNVVIALYVMFVKESTLHVCMIETL